MSRSKDNASISFGTTAVYGIFAIYLFVPLVVMIAMSFKDARFIGFPINSWTLRWYAQVIIDREVQRAAGLSLFIAAVSTAVAMPIGLWVGVFLSRLDRFKPLFFALVCLPAVIPGIISAISTRMFIAVIPLEPGTTAIALGHSMHAVPFVTLMVYARLGSMPPSLIEAAKDLGASDLVAFRLVTIPYLYSSLLGAFIFSLLLSFDDFVRAFFLGGYEPTLPVLIFARLQSGMSPEINAITTIILLITATCGLYAERSVRKYRS